MTSLFEYILLIRMLVIHISMIHCALSATLSPCFGLLAVMVLCRRREKGS